jgi:hypothetical protein
LVKTYRETPAAELRRSHGTEDAHPEFFLSRYDVPVFRATEVARLAAVDPGLSGFVRGKVVIVGGSYCESLDLHRTALGKFTSGSEIIAQAVAADLEGGAIGEAKEVLMVSLEICAGILLVILPLAIRPGRALVLSIAAIPLLAIGASYLAFQTSARWASMVPVCVSVLIHQLYESLQERRVAGHHGRSKGTGGGAA